MCRARLVLGAIFLTAIFAGTQGKYDLHSTYEINILGKLRYPLWQFWKNQELEIDDILTKTFKCPINEMSRFDKAVPQKKCPDAEWLQDVWTIVAINEDIMESLEKMRSVKYNEEHIDYMEQNKLLAPADIADCRKVLDYGKQFKLTLEKSVFNVYGSETSFPENKNTSYNGLLRSYKLKPLAKTQTQELSKLTKPIKQKLLPLSKKITQIAYPCGKEIMNHLYSATFNIFMAMNAIDSNLKPDERKERITKKNEELKKIMADPSLPKKINAEVDKLKPLMNEVVAAQRNLLQDIEKILKKGTKGK